ncbi:MAG: hypothetical protein Q9M27_02840 [Mariprofundaceae bacterium]|nr:hypothetical protein [Mariprofundaceae bacterium]
MKKTQLLSFVVGMTTGAGNGSVFVVCMNDFMGRGPYSTAGMWGFDAFNPVTFAGFENFVMMLFGVAFWAIMVIGLKMAAAAEGQPVIGQDFEAIQDAAGR